MPAHITPRDELQWVRVPADEIYVSPDRAPSLPVSELLVAWDTAIQRADAYRLRIDLIDDRVEYLAAQVASETTGSNAEQRKAATTLTLWELDEYRIAMEERQGALADRLDAERQAAILREAIRYRIATAGAAATPGR